MGQSLRPAKREKPRLKPKLHVVVGGAVHFWRWEWPFFEQVFEIVEKPHPQAVLLAFGPDVFEAAAVMPAQRRVAVLFPGFGCNPYHNLDYRQRALDLIDRRYDRVFVNPGPLDVAYRSSPKTVLCPFSLDTALVQCRCPRTRLDSLLHVSADYPQKDWPRSQEVMRRTGLRHEVFPPRETRRGLRQAALALSRTLTQRANNWLERRRVAFRFRALPEQYVKHSTVVKKYQAYDGFVHVAEEIPHPLHVDGKYTACLLEAGLTGAILFWHDTLNLGNNLETVFDLPVDPERAAQRILEIRSCLDVVRHSRRTRDEIMDKFNPERSVGFRCRKILELL